MYRAVMHIATCGVDERTVEHLGGIAPLDRFEHHIRAYSSFDAAPLAECDILIVNADACDLPHPARNETFAALVDRLRKRASAYVAVVLMASSNVQEQLDQDDLALIDALWSLAPTKSRIAFEFARLQQAAKRQADLHLYRTCLNTVIDSIPELIWFKDITGSHEKVNEAFCKAVGKTKEQVEGRGHYYIWDITPDEYAQGEYVCLESEDDTISAGRTCLFDEQVKTKDGMRQFKTYKSPLYDPQGAVMGTVGVAHDVTDLGNVETELRILIDSMPYAVVLFDTSDHIVSANECVQDYFGVDQEEVVGKSLAWWRASILGDNCLFEQTSPDSETIILLVRGREKAFRVSRSPIVDVFGNETGRMLLYRDVTAERELEEHIKKAAQTDYLTGLFNRRYFYEYFSEREERAITLIALDLNKFKGINDTFGHAAGDAALLRMTGVLRETFPDAIVARWGGDEFFVAIDGTGAIDESCSAVRAMAERLASWQKTEEEPWAFGVSAGISAGSSRDLDELVKRSDDALYQAKRSHEPYSLA